MVRGGLLVLVLIFAGCMRSGIARTGHTPCTYTPGHCCLNVGRCPGSTVRGRALIADPVRRRPTSAIDPFRTQADGTDSMSAGLSGKNTTDLLYRDEATTFRSFAVLRRIPFVQIIYFEISTINEGCDEKSVARRVVGPYSSAHLTALAHKGGPAARCGSSTLSSAPISKLVLPSAQQHTHRYTTWPPLLDALAHPPVILCYGQQVSLQAPP